MPLLPRAIVMKTPQAGGQLKFQSITGTETLGRIFEYEIFALAPVNNLDFKKLLGQHVTLMMEMGNSKIRFLDARIAKIGLVNMTMNMWRYRIVARPWTWMLTKTTDCKIFQEKNVPDIIKEVFGDQPNADFDFRLTGNYKPREYCVQYRETDYDFVTRLMEEEGIYTFFEHEDGKHTLVVCDAPSAHKSVGPIPYYPPDKAARGLQSADDFVSDWTISMEVQTGATALRDYDFEKPSVDLLVHRDKDLQYPEATHEVYDYPGEYLVVGDGEGIARTRLEELQAPFEVVQGMGNARLVTCGKTFALTEFARNDQNKEWLVVETTITASENAYESGAGEGGDYTVVFRLQPAKDPYRSPRTTPRPIVKGVQTAVVVGPSGEEIFVDKYGRIKVQFHWDRYGKYDDKSSCWMRVSQAWAGKQWGFVMNPRIGQEVIVSFLEGNPDNPIVTGRVYNAEQMPPYALPANMTQSGIKSRSSKGGTPSNFNELRFEDKKGEELYFMHAEKDMTTTVENDRSTHIARDDALTVDRDSATKIARNTTIEIKGTLAETIEKKVTNTYNNGLQETVTSGVDELYKAHHNVTVDGPRHEHVTGKATRYVTDLIKDECGGPINIAGTQLKVSATSSDMTLTAATDVKVAATGGKMVLSAGAAMEAGAASMLFNAKTKVEFFGMQFNRTIMQGNDIILGNNDNCYMGAASDTKIAMARASFVGISQENKLAVAMSTFLGVKLDAAAAVAVETVAAVGISQEALGLKQSGLKIFSGGGAGPGAAAASAGAASSAIAAIVSGLSVVAGIAATVADLQAMMKSYEEAAARADEVGRHDLAQAARAQASYLAALIRVAEAVPALAGMGGDGDGGKGEGKGDGKGGGKGDDGKGGGKGKGDDGKGGGKGDDGGKGKGDDGKGSGKGDAGKGDAGKGAGDAGKGAGDAGKGAGGKGGGPDLGGGKGKGGGIGSQIGGMADDASGGALGGKGKGIGGVVDDIASGKASGSSLGKAADSLSGGALGGKGKAIGSVVDDIVSGKATGSSLGKAADNLSGGALGGMGGVAGGLVDDVAGTGGKGGDAGKGKGDSGGKGDDGGKGKGDDGKGGGKGDAGKGGGDAGKGDAGKGGDSGGKGDAGKGGGDAGGKGGGDAGGKGDAGKGGSDAGGKGDAGKGGGDAGGKGDAGKGGGDAGGKGDAGKGGGDAGGKGDAGKGGGDAGGKGDAGKGGGDAGGKGGGGDAGKGGGGKG